MQMSHTCNKALIWNENRSFLKERRPLHVIKSKNQKAPLSNKYNSVGRAPHFLASNFAALSDCFNKKQESNLIHFRIRQN